jgi:hypothetical protein
MATFDLAKSWLILSPEGQGFEQAHRAAADLARIIAALRAGAGLPAEVPAVLDAQGPAPADDKPIIVLNAGENAAEAAYGWSWRAGSDRVEVYGNSPACLARGLYDFCAHLGLKWEGPGNELLPPVKGNQANLDTSSNYRPELEGDSLLTGLKRFAMPSRAESPELWGCSADKLLLYLTRQGCEALILPFAPGAGGFFEGLKRKKEAALRQAILEKAGSFGIGIEAGGWGSLSSLVPARLFHKDKAMFRMEGGERKNDHLFCPTNPQALQTLKANAKKQFATGDGALWPAAVKIFDVWPETLEEKWCACPACRAFSPTEQNRMACNAAADILAGERPQARLCYREIPSLTAGADLGDVPVRANMFTLKEKIYNV